MKKVLVSPGFGSGWSTWNEPYGKALAEDELLIEMVEAGKHLGETTYARLAADGIKVCPSLVADSGLGVMRVAASHAFAMRACEIVGTGDVPYMGGVSDLEVEQVVGRYRIKEYDGSESIEREWEADWW